MYTAACYRDQAHALLTNAYVNSPANHDGTNPEADRSIAEAQAYATLAIAQALTPEDPTQAKPTGWVYRVTVDKYPTSDGRPFIDQGEDYWLKVLENHDAGKGLAWLPENLEEWRYTPGSWGEMAPPRLHGRTIHYPDNPFVGMLVVPTLPSRRHWLARATARSIANDLRAWGAEVRLERAPFAAWETVATN